MKIMIDAIEQKIKRAALQTALRHLLRRSSSCAQRAARNMIEFAASLSDPPRCEEELAQIYEQLLPIVRNCPPDEAAGWLIDRLGL